MSSTPKWRKSSRSGQGNNCVEVATNVPQTPMIRDSKLGDDSPIMNLTPEAFKAFIAATKADKFS